jgi:SAM-dependent methyltransferase
LIFGKAARRTRWVKWVMAFSGLIWDKIGRYLGNFGSDHWEIATMSPDEIRAGVEALQPWFHQIDLGHGIKTKARPISAEPVDHPFGTWQIIRRCIPEDFAGQSVLDVGCNAGFYAIEAKRRNAGRVLGVDAQRPQVDQARFASTVLGLDIEYKQISVYDLNPQILGKFDFTLALGLIYHCKHVIMALEKLFQVTRGMLVLESAVFPSSLLFESFSQETEDIGRRFHAIAYVENDLPPKKPYTIGSSPLSIA